MKKIISLLVVIALMATLATTAFAAKAGETTTVYLSVNENPGFNNFGAVIDYPADVLELVEVKEAGILEGKGSGKYNDATHKYGFFAGYDITETGALLALTFKVKENAAAGEYAVSATLDANSTSNQDGVKVVFDIIGTVVVVEGEHVHQWGEWVEIQAPDCTEYGVDQRTCATCGETETRQGREPLGHAFGAWLNYNDPSYHRHVCARCDVKEYEAHKMEYVGEATKEIDGVLYNVKTHECSVCHYTVEGLDEIPLTGDITPVVVGSAVAVIAMITLAGYMLKRKFAL